MEIDLPEVVAEVRAAFDRYEQALVSNDAAILGATFRDDPRTIRYGIAENLYGYKEIEAFRARSSGPGPRSEYGDHDLRPRFCCGLDAVLSCWLTGQGQSPDADMGTLPEGWRVVAAHVSNIDEPPVSKK